MRSASVKDAVSRPVFSATNLKSSPTFLNGGKPPKTLYAPETKTGLRVSTPMPIKLAYDGSMPSFFAASLDVSPVAAVRPPTAAPAALWPAVLIRGAARSNALPASLTGPGPNERIFPSP